MAHDLPIFNRPMSYAKASLWVWVWVSPGIGRLIGLKPDEANKKPAVAIG
jgi:hypothetical protein